MKLWCYGVDKGEWGQQLAAEACECDIDAHVFTDYSPEMRKGDYVFMRVPQWEPELSHAKKLARYLIDKGLVLIPDLFTVYAYEDKMMQSLAYADWMPETFVLRAGEDSWPDAVFAIHQLGLPFLSKSKEASSSANVRMIDTVDKARNEWELAMKGQGLCIKIGKGRTGRQIGYLLWQKFCPGNEGDLRVCINGNYMLLLERDNAPNSFFASGSGSNRPVNDPTPRQQDALRVARDFFTVHGLKWNGIDLVFDYDINEWKILETTLDWSASAYEDCLYFGANYPKLAITSTEYRGRDTWRLFCEQLKEGVFG